MATGGLYGSSGTGALIAQPGSESSGLYGNSTSFGGTYFEWFVFQTSETQPATPTGGTWNFTTNANTPPTGWSSAPPSNPLNTVWVSIAIVNSKNTAPLVWSVPGKFAFSSGLPILFGNGAPQPGDGQSDQLYVQLDTTPQTIWAKETGTWTRLTGSTLYADLTSNQTIAGTKTFSSQIQGSISGTASNVTGTVAISNGGTGATTAASARAALGAAELGANADITSMTGVTGGISTPDFVQFDTGITPTVGVGKLQWDPTYGCMQVGLIGGNVNLQIGEETVAYIYNNTGSTITEGQVVRVVGSQGQRLTVALAQANGDPNSATILGMATENIANNSSGFITTQGIVNNLNTSGFADGTLLYLSPTVPGGVTATKPVAPQHLVWIGYVVKGNSGGAGSIYIHTQNGYELDELHNVKITDPVADNSFLVYDATLEVWQNEAPSAARTSLGLGSAAVLNAGAANGVATLDAGGTVPLSQIPASIQGGVSYQGTWNATTNTPTLTSSVGTKGYYYVVSVAGSTNLNGITSWNIGDWAIYNGTAWEKIDNTDAVTSVNGYTGTVVLNYADVGAPSTTGVNATGTWGINVTGNAATATTAGSATTATTATNVSGGTASVTTLTTSSTVTLNGGTANGVAYLNGSKVLTSGSALTFDGTTFGNTGGIVAGGSSPFYGAAGRGNVTSRGTSSAIFALGVNGVEAGYLFGTGSAVTLGAPTGVPITFDINGEQMRLTPTGLGIGTSSPGAKLNVVTAGTALANFTGAQYSQLRHSDGTRTLYTQVYDNLAIFGTESNTPLSFVTNSTVKATIDSSGNLGIGTSSPGARLVAAAASPIVASRGTAYLYSTDSMGANLGGQLSLGGSYTGTTETIFASIAGRKENGTNNDIGGYLQFSTTNVNLGNTERMRLDSSGNLGLGVTPSAGDSYYRKLELGKPGCGIAAATTALTSSELTYFTGNAVVTYTGGNPWVYGNAGGAGIYGIEDGIHKWSVAGSGTAGAAISFTQAMTLDASGNLGVGTTSPLAKLHTGGSGTVSNYITTADSGGVNLYLQVSGSAANIGSPNGVPLTFMTANVERARIDSSGNLLVGTTSGSNHIFRKDINSIAFTVENLWGNTSQTYRSSMAAGADNTSSYHFVGRSGTNDKIYIYGNGNVVNSNNSYGSMSDAKLKENVVDATPKLEKLQQVRVVNYNLIGQEQKQLGVVAQELEQIFPNMVEESPDLDAKGNVLGTTTKSVKYSVFVPMLIKAIQEQQAIIEDMKTRLAALESN